MLRIPESNAPNIGLTELETVWWGDEAIVKSDDDRTILDRWATTGEVDGIKFVQGKGPDYAPSRVRYRALDELELLAVPDASSVGPRLRLFTAARYGVIAIDGVDLMRVRDDSGFTCITVSEMQRVNNLFRAKIPMWRAMRQWIAAELGRDALASKGEGVDEDVGLPIWIGAQILARSFPEG